MHPECRVRRPHSVKLNSRRKHICKPCIIHNKSRSSNLDLLDTVGVRGQCDGFGVLVLGHVLRGRPLLLQPGQDGALPLGEGRHFLQHGGQHVGGGHGGQLDVLDGSLLQLHVRVTHLVLVPDDLQRERDDIVTSGDILS